MSQSCARGREGQLGVGSSGEGIREKQLPEWSHLRLELADKEVICGWAVGCVGVSACNLDGATRCAGAVLRNCSQSWHSEPGQCPGGVRGLLG